MDEQTRKLFQMIEAAEAQQKAVTDALAGLQARDGELQQTIAQLRAVTQALTPAVKEAAGEAVKTGLAAPCEALTDALVAEAKPALVELAQFRQATTVLREASQQHLRWLNWKAGLFAGAMASIVLAATAAVLYLETAYVRDKLDKALSQQVQADTDTAIAKQSEADIDKHIGGVRIVHGSQGAILSVPYDDQQWKCEDDRSRCIQLKLRQ